MSSLPTLSIVTPSFNQAKFLEQTLRSVISQRDQVHEYFVYDAASTDGSLDILQRYQKQLDFWTTEKDKGQPDAIAKGFARATGDFLGWVNSDDVYIPGALAKVREALAAHPDWDCITGWHVRIDENTRIRSAHRHAAESAAAARRGVFHPNQPTVFFRRSLYEKVGGMNLDLHLVLDTELFFRFLDAGARWGIVNGYVAGFREHGTSKGIGTPQKWAHEFALLDQRYPHYHGEALRHRLGRLAHQAGQLLSGRALAARRDTQTMRGKTVEEVFGPWLTPKLEPADG